MLATLRWPRLAPRAAGDDELARDLAHARDRYIHRRLPLYAAALAVLPDADVLMHAFVRYSHPFGHRGAFHSLAFYAALSLALAALPVFRNRRAYLLVAFFVALVSHSLLDMLTNGGLGIGLFWPVSDARLFFPWRPIPVSPLGIASFFSIWGVRVLRVELSFALPLFALALWLRRRAGAFA